MSGTGPGTEPTSSVCVKEDGVDTAYYLEKAENDGGIDSFSLVK